ncbi:MAG: glycosyltransferase family 87 protein [Propionibacteriaceae bacterium]
MTLLTGLDALWKRRGGTIGCHSLRKGIWFTAAPWTLLTAILTWLILWARQLPCRTDTINNSPNAFYRMCYSDIPVLYQSRHLGQGIDPYALEYPVLIGAAISLGRMIAQIFGAPFGVQVTPQQELDGANIFFAVTSILMFIAFIATVIAHITMDRRRPWDGLMIAASPMVAAAGLVNWDMLAVGLTSVAIWYWSRKRSFTAGLFLGLGIAAKLYPFVLLVPLFVICIRSNRWKAYLLAVAGTVIAWAIPNGIIAITDLEAWQYFWRFNVDRGSDFGSFWYALQLMGADISGVSLLTAILNIVGAIALLGIGIFAPQRPRLGQLCFLMLCWFLMVNKVYSPQYVLWLLPFVVLARPRWRDWTIWTIGELIYFAAVWGTIAGKTQMPGTTFDHVYVASIMIRLMVEGWLMAQIVKDIFHPEQDIVRDGDVDDPLGGVVDLATDAAWVKPFKRMVFARVSDSNQQQNLDDDTDSLQLTEELV